MGEFTHVVKKNSIHARYAVAITNFVKQNSIEAVIYKGNKTANASDIVQLLKLKAIIGDELNICVKENQTDDTKHEKRGERALKTFFEENI